MGASSISLEVRPGIKAEDERRAAKKIASNGSTVYNGRTKTKTINDQRHEPTRTQ